MTDSGVNKVPLIFAAVKSPVAVILELAVRFENSPNEASILMTFVILYVSNIFKSVLIVNDAKSPAPPPPPPVIDEPLKYKVPPILYILSVVVNNWFADKIRLILIFFLTFNSFKDEFFKPRLLILLCVFKLFDNISI